jgi:hypothetical protein
MVFSRSGNPTKEEKFLGKVRSEITRSYATPMSPFENMKIYGVSRDLKKTSFLRDQLSGWYSQGKDTPTFVVKNNH